MGDLSWSKIGAHFSEQTAQKSTKNERERKLKKRACGTFAPNWNGLRKARNGL